MSGEGGGVAGGRCKTTRRIPGAEVSRKVTMFTELAEGQFGTSSSSPGLMNHRCRSNGSGQSGVRADSQEDLPLLAAGEGDDAADLDCLEVEKEISSSRHGGGGNLQKGKRKDGESGVLNEINGSPAAKAKFFIKLGTTSLLPTAAKHRHGDDSGLDGDRKAAEDGPGEDGHSKEAPQQQLQQGKEAGAGELANGSNGSQEIAVPAEDAAGAKPNDSSPTTLPQGSTNHGIVIGPNWEGMEDAAAVQRFVRRAVKEGLEAAAVKDQLEGNAARDLILQEALREGLQGASVKEFIQQAVEDGLKDAGVQNFILQIVNESLKGAATKDWVLEVVNEAIVKHMPVAQVAANNIPDMDRLKEEMMKEDKMKQQKDYISEHASLSRVLFAAALAFILPYMIARKNTQQGKADEVTEADIKDMAIEIGITFCFEIISYVYMLTYHFIGTSSLGLLLSGRIITASLLGSLVTLWVVFYTFCIPRFLFKKWFWYISGCFIVANWVFTILIGWCKLVTHKYFLEE